MEEKTTTFSPQLTLIDTAKPGKKAGCFRLREEWAVAGRWGEKSVRIMQHTRGLVFEDDNTGESWEVTLHDLFTAYFAHFRPSNDDGSES